MFTPCPDTPKDDWNYTGKKAKQHASTEAKPRATDSSFVGSQLS